MHLLIAGVIDSTRHLDCDDFFRDLDEDEQRPQCENDSCAEGVRERALGEVFPALMPNCPDCGTYDSDDDDDDDLDF